MVAGMNVTPKNENLFETVKSAGRGEIALPQFQRSFVWTAGDIQELLVSVFKRHFIGSLLTLNIDQGDPPFSIRAIEGSFIQESEMQSRASTLLLDGQQRISSLYYALNAPDIPLAGGTKQPTIFFLDLKRFFCGEIDRAISYKLKSRCEPDELECAEYQFRNLKIPFAVVKRWGQWYTDFVWWFKEGDSSQHPDWDKGKLTDLNERITKVLQFSQPILSLPKIESGNRGQLEEVCTIFEKQNSTGVSLSVFDLLTERLYPQGVSLDALWNKALDDCKPLEEFGADKSRLGVFILRFIALIREEDMRSKALVSLKPKDFREDWERAIWYFNLAYQQITASDSGGFGAFNIKWLPYTTVIPVLAALLHVRDCLPAERRASASKAIEWWYWAAVFTRRYAGPVETMTQRDYIQMRDYFEKDDASIPDVFVEVNGEVLRPESNFSLSDAQRANSTIYRAVMCLLSINGAKDWQLGAPIVFSQLEDHHIFPKSYLSKTLKEPVFGLSGAAARNTIINRTLISGSANKIIGGRRPSEYLRDAKVISQDEREKRIILAKHFVDDAALAAMESDNYDTFLRARESAIITRIRDLFVDMPRPPRQD